MKTRLCEKAGQQERQERPKAKEGAAKLAEAKVRERARAQFCPTPEPETPAKIKRSSGSRKRTGSLRRRTNQLKMRSLDQITTASTMRERNYSQPRRTLTRARRKTWQQTWWLCMKGSCRCGKRAWKQKRRKTFRQRGRKTKQAHWRTALRTWRRNLKGSRPEKRRRKKTWSRQSPSISRSWKTRKMQKRA